MAILECFEAFRTGLATVLATSTTGATGEQPVRMELGEKFLDLLEEYIGQGQNKPMIVWVPIGASRIEQLAGLRDGVPALHPASAAKEGITKPLRIAARDEVIDVFVWAKDIQTAERLMNHMVATCQFQATSHSFKPISTRWSVGDDPRKPKQGTLAILRVSIKIPFTAEPDQIATAPFTPDVTGTFVQTLSIPE